ncbi:MAG: hypothetical protein ACFHWX_22845 [Bacteroidota bacterium]
MKKLNRASILIIILGLIVSIIALETIPQNAFKILEDQHASQTDDQKSSEDTTISTQSIIALPLSLEFHIDPELFLLNTIPEPETQDTPNTLFAGIIDKQQKVLKVLFRRIISPNAP